MGTSSDWEWTDKGPYIEGKCGAAKANISHRKGECWRVFARVEGRYVRADVSARLSPDWPESKAHEWVQDWATAQLSSIAGAS